MIRIFFFILFFAGLIGNAQFTNNHSFSSQHTLETALGGLKVNRGFVNTIYADSTAANLQAIDAYPGGQFFANDTLHIRSSDGTRWLQFYVGAGGGGAGSVTNFLFTDGNGVDGTVTLGTSTPTLSLAFTPVGILKSNGTAMSAAVLGTDYSLINGTGFVKATGTTISYDNSTYIKEDGWYNIVRDGGADSTGTTDVSAIVQNAINAGWKGIDFPHGTFLVSNQIELKDSVTIRGRGRFASRIKLTTDITAFHCSFALGGNNTTFSDIGFYGDYATGGLTTQRGVSIDSAQSILIKSISGVNMGGFVVNILQNAYSTSYLGHAGKSNTVTDSYFEANYGGVNFGLRAEYNLIANSTFTGNVYAIQNLAGNSRISNNTLVTNTYGLYMTSSTNGGHGVATDNTFNHNATNLYMSGITSGFSFTNNTFVQNNAATAGLIELISCANVFFYGGFLSNDTIRTTLCTTISFDNVNPYQVALNPVFVVVSGSAPTVTYAGRVQNSMTLRDVTNSKQLDITYLNGETNFTGTSGNTFGFLNAAADSTVDITGSLRATTGVRFSGLPTAVGVYAVRADANGTLSLADTTIGGGTSPFLPVTGTGTATGAIIGSLDGNTLSINQGANSFLSIDPTAGAEQSIFTSYNVTGLGNQSGIAAINSDTQSIFTVFADFNGGAESASIFGTSQSGISDIQYISITHQFTGNVGIGVAPTVLFQVQSGGNDFLFIDPTAGSEISQIKAYNTTGDDNVAGFAGVTSNSDAQVYLSAEFNGAAKSASIVGVSNTTDATLSYSADTHTFTGDILTATDNTYDIGSASAAFKDIYGRTIHLDGATSGGISIFSDAIGNAINGTTLTGNGVIWSTSGGYVDSDFTLADVNTAQNVFPSGYDVWTLQASTTYRFKGKYFISTGGGNVSVAMSFALGGGASVTSIRYGMISGIFNDGSTSGTQLMGRQNDVASWVVTSSSATSGRYIDFEGIIRINAGGTITPQITFSAAPGGTNLLNANSFIEFTPIGTNTITSIGPAS